jgi:hypothetical protein
MHAAPHVLAAHARHYRSLRAGGWRPARRGTLHPPVTPEVPVIQIDHDTVRLASGMHENAPRASVPEFGSLLAGGAVSNRAPCVSRTIATFLRAWNDAMDDRDRQMLRPYMTRALGAATSEEDELIRAWLAADWLVRVQTPAWLRLVGMDRLAQVLEQHSYIGNATAARAARGVLHTARNAVAAAGVCASASIAGNDDGGAEVAGDAVGAAAWDAAVFGGSCAATTGAVCWTVCWTTGRLAAKTQGPGALRDTVTALQRSALMLLERMIEVKHDVAPDPRRR